MSTENEKLIAEAREYIVQFGYRNTLIGRLADSLEAATKPVTVSTVEDLDALAAGSVVLDAGAFVCEKNLVGPLWMVAGDEDLYPAAEIDLPATVLYATRQAVSNG